MRHFSRMRPVLIGVVFLLLLTPVAFAQDWEATCIGNVLVENTTITVDGDVIPIIQNTTCSYGCDTGRRECIGYGGTPGQAMPGSLFIVFELLAIALLFVSFFPVDAAIKMICGLVSAVIFLPLGLLSLNVIFEGVVMQIDWLGWLNFAFGFLGIIMFFAGMFYLMRRETKVKL